MRIDNLAVSDVEVFDDGLSKLNENLQFFTTSLRLIFVTTSDTTNEEIIKLRNSIRDDSQIYLRSVLPYSKETTKSISTALEHYLYLDYDTWERNLDRVIKIVTKCKDLSSKLLQLNKEMLKTLKERQFKAESLAKEMNNLETHYREMKLKFENEGKNMEEWARKVGHIPIFNIFLYPLFEYFSRIDFAKAKSSHDQEICNGAAVLCIKDKIVPIVENFVSGLKGIFGFFCILENELTGLQKLGKEASEEASEVHFDLMKKKSEVSLGICQNLIQLLPIVEIDLEGIPKDGTDESYIEKMVKHYQTIINKKT